MKHSYASVAVLAAALALVFSVIACGQRDAPEVSATGQVSLHLTGTSSSGVVYRLRHATFEITGPAAARLSTENDPDAQFLATELAVGAYRVHLKPGWFLEKQTGASTFQRVEAHLTSDNPVSFEIRHQRTTTVRFRFQVGADDCELGGGTLTIGIDVDDSPKGCRLHADCPSAVCDTYAADGAGACIDGARVLYVQKLCEGWPGSGGTGTQADPFCQIREAVTAAQESGRDVIRVLPGHYFPFAVTGQKLQLFGPAGEGGSASVGEEDSGAVAVLEGADVLLDGFVLGGPTRHGLLCRGPSSSTRAVVRRSSLGADVGWALQALGCEVALDRVILQTRPVSVELTDTRFVITNAFVGGQFHHPSAISIQGSEGVIGFSTLALTRFPNADGGSIDCGTSTVRIQDSIVAGAGAYPDTGSRFRGSCLLERVVVGNDPIESPGAIRKTPTLVDGYRLPYSPENVDCCIDRAEDGAALRWDIEGTRRPQGERADLGAYEVQIPALAP